MYSPDLNPIEEAFSCIKAWIRGNHNYAHSELIPDDLQSPIHLYFVIWEAVLTAISPEKIEGWFKDSGYL